MVSDSWQITNLAGDNQEAADTIPPGSGGVDRLHCQARGEGTGGGVPRGVACQTRIPYWQLSRKSWPCTYPLMTWQVP